MLNIVNVPCNKCGEKNELVAKAWYRTVRLENNVTVFQVQVVPKKCESCDQLLELAELSGEEMQEYLAWYNKIQISPL